MGAWLVAVREAVALISAEHRFHTYVYLRNL
jgi:hypothetical protein